jgi:type IV pilus assembly protein PilA
MKLASTLRKRTGGESGFTLIELLVVMLILGILASIAIVAFLNQSNKAHDAQAKTNARTLQTAMEACATDNQGDYSNCGITALRAIESSIPQTGNSVRANSTSNTWTVSADSTNNNIFTISRNSSGVVTRSCTVPSGSDRGACKAGDTW